MPRNKRLRVFAGPNGSGKSTLFNEFKKQYDPGYFINADKLEKQLAKILAHPPYCTRSITLLLTAWPYSTQRRYWIF